MAVEEAYKNFFKSSVRAPRQGTYERLIAQHLIAAVSSNPLKKIRLICEVVMTVDSAKLKINEDEIETLYRTTLSFIKTRHYRFGSNHYCFMSFPFEINEDNYIRYIKPWRTRSNELRYYPLFPNPSSHFHQGNFNAEKDKIVNDIKKLKYWDQFFWITQRARLTDLCYTELENMFIAWAIPQALKLFIKVAKVVSPDVYSNVLSTMTKSEESIKDVVV